MALPGEQEISQERYERCRQDDVGQSARSMCERFRPALHLPHRHNVLVLGFTDRLTRFFQSFRIALDWLNNGSDLCRIFWDVFRENNGLVIRGNGYSIQ